MIARLAVIVTLAVGLSGCATSATPGTFASLAAPKLQAAVLEVTQATYDGDFAQAAAHLDALEVSTIAAYARGELSESRFNAIMMAIALVRADLDEAILANTQQVEPSPDMEPVSPVEEQVTTPPTDGLSGTTAGSTSSGSSSESTKSKSTGQNQADKSNNGRGSGDPPGKRAKP
jgi:hypothetical protein